MVNKVVLPEISFIKPYWGTRELLYGCFYRDNGNNNSREELVKRLKNKLNIKGTIILTSSGRTAFELALRVLKNKYPGKNKVIIPVYGCKGIFDPVVKTGLIPILADIEKDLNITARTVEDCLKDDVLAILITHLGGCGAEVEKIAKLAKEKSIVAIEDICQSLGGKDLSKFRGTQYDMAIFSFGMGKNLMATAGGMLVSNVLEKAIMEESKTLSNENDKIVRNRFDSVWLKCFLKKADDFDNCGIMNSYGYSKMHPLDAGLVSLQLSRLGDIIQRRKQNAARVIKELKKTGLKFHLQDSKNNVYTKLSVIFENVNECSRLKSSFHKLGIETEEMYTPLHTSGDENSCPYVESIYKNVFNIPIRPNLRKRELTLILKAISNFK